MRLAHHETDRRDSTTSSRLYLDGSVYHIVTEYDSAQAYYRLADAVTESLADAQNIYNRQVRTYHRKGGRA